jgi:hypothetical protein
MVSTYNKTTTHYPSFCVPPIQWVPGDLSSGLKRPGREADPSPLTSAQFEKTWTYTSTLPYVFIAWCLVSKAKGQFYLLLRRNKTYCN